MGWGRIVGLPELWVQVATPFVMQVWKVCSVVHCLVLAPLLMPSFL